MLQTINDKALGYEVRTTKSGGYLILLYYKRTPRSEVSGGQLYYELKCFTEDLPVWLDDILSKNHNVLYQYHDRFGYLVQAVTD